MDPCTVPNVGLDNTPKGRDSTIGNSKNQYNVCDYNVSNVCYMCKPEMFSLV